MTFILSGNVPAAARAWLVLFRGSFPDGPTLTHAVRPVRAEVPWRGRDSGPESGRTSASVEGGVPWTGKEAS